MKDERIKPWDASITDYLTTPPNDPTEREKLLRVIEETQKASAIGLVAPLKQGTK